MTKFTFEFATRDDCLDRMIPSDLRGIISERDALRAEIARLREALSRFGDRARMSNAEPIEIQQAIDRALAEGDG